MGRSVAWPSGATCIAYLADPAGMHDEGVSVHEAADNWDFFMENLGEALKRRFKSLRPCDRWVESECHAVLENDHGMVVVAEYCGMVTVSLLPHPFRYDDDSLANLREQWCRRVERSFLKVLDDTFPGTRCVKQGTMSNGCGVYARV